LDQYKILKNPRGIPEKSLVSVGLEPIKDGIPCASPSVFLGQF